MVFDELFIDTAVDEEDVGEREDVRGQPWWRLPKGWWLQIGTEDPVASERCPNRDLYATVPSPADVYCPEHGDALLLQDLTGRRRWWAFNLVRTVVVGLVVLAANYDSNWPVYLLAVAAGAACIGLPLHAHRIARLVGIAAWLMIAAVAAGVVVADLDADGLRIVWTVAVALPLGVALLLGLDAIGLLARKVPQGVERQAPRAVAFAFGVAAGALSLWWMTEGWFADRFVELPDSASRWLLFSSLGTALSGLLAAAIGAFVLSLDRMDTDVGEWGPRLLRSGDLRYTPKFRPRPTRRALQAQLFWRLHQLGQRLRRSSVALLNQILNGVRAVANTLLKLVAALANWLRRRLVLLARRTRFVLREGARIVGQGLIAGLLALDYVWRPVAAWVCAVVGAVVAIHLSSGFTDYLVDGPIAGLAAGVGWSAAGIVMCFFAADRLASVPTRHMLRAQGGIVSNGGPDIVLFTVLAGWVVGIPGSLGYGPIRVGWVTVVGTIVLSIIMAPEWMRDRRITRAEAAKMATG